MSTTGGLLLLVRHAAPVIEIGRPASEWSISNEGIHASRRLASRIDDSELVAIITSSEPKAAATAEVLAGSLGMNWSSAEGLHEHERGVLPWIAEDEWRAQLTEFFARPDELVFGLESANQALRRFREAVGSVLDTAGVGDVVIVSHGTVMALLLAEITGQDAFEIWSDLEMPDLRRVSRMAFAAP